MTLGTLAVFGLAGCSGSEPKPEEDFGCYTDGVKAPEWTCVPSVEGAYADLGSAPMSVAGMGFSRREALANGRSNLAQQIESKVKDKVETFARSTGIGAGETADKVSTQVSKQVALVTLKGSKQVEFWQHPKSKTIYLLVAVPEDFINEEAKEMVKSSYKNDNALWQQFQSKNALEALEKEFSTN